MSERTVNAPIAGTFGWLGVGGTRAEIEGPERHACYELSENELRTEVIRDGEEDLAVTADIPDGARLDLVMIRSGEGIGTGVSDIRVKCGKNASFHWYRVLLDGEKSYDNCSVQLVGDGSSFSADIGYRLEDSESYDVNCEAIHLGRNTASAIRSSGVLAQNSGKLLRGTIDFRTGCSGSSGEELDDVLLLSDSARNRTVPVILCAEEDVAGNHGATIGRPDERVLYYLESRGLERQAAIEMLASAKIDAVIGRIPDERLREKLREELHERG